MKHLTYTNIATQMILFFAILLASSLVVADQTYMLQLNKEINQESKRLEQAIKEIDEIKVSKGGEKFIKQARKAPRDSVDSRYAYSKYVNEEIKSRMKEYSALVNLGQSTEKLTELVKTFHSQLKNENETNKGLNLKTFNKDTAMRLMKNIKGTDRVTSILFKNKSLMRSGKADQIYSNYMVQNNLKGLYQQRFNAKGGYTNEQAIVAMYKNLKLQRPVIKSSLLLLDNEIQRLKGMQLKGNTNIVFKNIRGVVKRVSQITSGKESLKRNKRHAEMESFMEVDSYDDFIQPDFSNDEEFYSQVAEYFKDK